MPNPSIPIYVNGVANAAQLTTIGYIGSATPYAPYFSFALVTVGWDSTDPAQIPPGEEGAPDYPVLLTLQSGDSINRSWFIGVDGTAS
jgi:hypothetical protein